MDTRKALLLSITSLLAVFICQTAQAQELTVKSFELVPNDATAKDEKYQRVDDNGNLAGLVKVIIPKDGVEFDGGMILDSRKWNMSEYWVWMADGATKLTVLVTGFQPLVVNFRDYDFKMLHSKNTYKLMVNVPKEITHEIKTETFRANGVSFNMIQVEGGTFMMGATNEQEKDALHIEKPAHSVKLDDYLIGETEVTQELWEAVMGTNPSGFKGVKNPVENVSWKDCQAFIGKLNALTGQQFRLPTEAEWEYAARGGNMNKQNKYSGSNNPDDVAWFMQNSGDMHLDESIPTWDTDRLKDNHCMPHHVGAKQANELGLYDMSGNVWEWCQDWFAEDAYDNLSTQTNPKGATKGTVRILRGGSFFSRAKSLRVSYRNAGKPDISNADCGFRLAL